MDSTLDVNIRLNENCDMYAVDNSDYSQIIEDDIKTHAIVEVLKNSDDVIINQRLHVIRGEFDPLVTVSESMLLPTDGLYTYYRMVIPTFEHFKNEETHQYDVENTYFAKIVYNHETNKHEEEIYFSEENLESFDKTRVRLVEDYQEVWDYRENDNQIFWFNGRFFSICRLNNCLTLKIKKSLDRIKQNGCVFDCEKTNDEQVQTDFLLEGSFAIKYLTEQHRFEDAQRILQTVNSCGGICNEGLNTDLSNCNCGKAL